MWVTSWTSNSKCNFKETLPISLLEKNRMFYFVGEEGSNDVRFKIFTVFPLIFWFTTYLLLPYSYVKMKTSSSMDCCWMLLKMKTWIMIDEDKLFQRKYRGSVIFFRLKVCIWISLSLDFQFWIQNVRFQIFALRVWPMPKS